VKRFAALTVVILTVGGIVAIVLIGDNGSEEPTAADVERRLRERRFFGENERPNAVSCRPSKERGYFDCEVWFQRRQGREGDLAPRVGYDLLVRGRETGGLAAGPWFSARLSSWSSAATSYNTTFQECARQPHPVRGFMPACTREYRRKYERAAARLRRVFSASPACARALARARSLAAEVTSVLARAFRSVSAALDAAVEGRSFQGVRRPFAAASRADRVTRRNVKIADRLDSVLRQNCAGG
jgi:hypothetical protein